MDAINNVTLEKYAELCALMSDVTDEAKQDSIAEANGVTAADWRAAKDGFTKKMMDPSDMGKTAMAFMPLLQTAQAKARGGKEPCTLEVYTKVHAEMAYLKDPADPNKQIDFNVVLQQNGFTNGQWLECENYWTPVVSSDPNLPAEMQQRFNPELSMKFKTLMQQESDRIFGIKR